MRKLYHRLMMRFHVAIMRSLRDDTATGEELYSRHWMRYERHRKKLKG